MGPQQHITYPASDDGHSEHDDARGQEFEEPEEGDRVERDNERRGEDAKQLEDNPASYGLSSTVSFTVTLL